MGILSCFCFPRRRKVSPDNNVVSEEQHPNLKQPNYPTVQRVDKEDSQTKSKEQESRTQQAQSSTSSLNINVPANTKVNKQRKFSYQELVKATDNFKSDHYLGEGGFGEVYKGKLENPKQVVAIKKKNRDGLQGHKEFLVEITMLSLAEPMLVDKRRYVKLADPKMKGEFMHRPLKKTVQVALMCMNDDFEKRPDMSEVVDTLDLVASLSDPHGGSNQNQDSDSESDFDSDSMFKDDEEERAKAIAEAKMWGEKFRHETTSKTSI
ncbi:hypothetical protein M8C21_024299 [Ambrosia artemisiifolia]|uniref:Protein kinase domain-containing protein n=1 Tax=Ambrosia artemisiifolia TaxID=4212 RepID=A0AAD5CJC6_AMBAR|nr:hypothetical protein M8C21_024299 [Ambrosia artemisiifolia]